MTNENRDKGDKGVEWSDKDIAEKVTPRAEFKLEKMPYGYYRIYAVANMGDMEEYEEEIKTVKGLKGISLTWQADVAKNNQMLGYFMPEGLYTDNDVVKINKPGRGEAGGFEGDGGIRRLEPERGGVYLYQVCQNQGYSEEVFFGGCQ